MLDSVEEFEFNSIIRLLQSIKVVFRDVTKMNIVYRERWRKKVRLLNCKEISKLQGKMH